MFLHSMNAMEFDNEIDAVYKEMILDLYRNPLHKKEVDNPDFKHREYNKNCGDEIQVAIRFGENGQVQDVGHQGVGCAISQASVSLLTDYIQHKTKEEIQNITKDDVLSLLQIPISHTRLKCALLSWRVLQSL